MGEVTGVSPADKCVLANGVDRENVRINYDYLILATGASHNYFGHGEFEKHAPGLKGLADAVAIRNKILTAFEQAEAGGRPQPSPRPADVCACGRRADRCGNGRRDRRFWSALPLAVGVSPNRSRIRSNCTGRLGATGAGNLFRAPFERRKSPP